MICLITDGFGFSAKQEYLFVTTDNTLKNYLAGRPELPKDLAELSRTGEFLCSRLYEEQGFEAYQRCYDREAKNQQFFASLEKQAQSIVHRLLRNWSIEHEDSRSAPFPYFDTDLFGAVQGDKV
jgi:hypothetical protein